MIMDTFRRRRLIQLTAVMMIGMCCANVLAEPIHWPPGKAPSVSLENKIGKSTGAAHIIVVGSSLRFRMSVLPGFALTVKKGSVTFPNGDREGYLSVTPVWQVGCSSPAQENSTSARSFPVVTKPKTVSASRPRKHSAFSAVRSACLPDVF